MICENATEVRKEWSAVCDTVSREKPVFIKRTRDKFLLSDIRFIEELLRSYSFSATCYKEKNGSVTISLNEIDLVENGKDEAEARLNMGKALVEYAQEYYENYSLYSNAPNRRPHIPYVFKALMIDDPKAIGEGIRCRVGKN